jgi:hypothetical protein
VGAPDRHDAGDAPPGADDHVAADLLAEDAVRAADIAGALGSDRGRLEAKPVFADRAGGLVDDLVLGRAPCLERQVVARQLELEPDHVGRENAERLLEELLPGVVALEHDDSPCLHRGLSVVCSAAETVKNW